MIESLSLLNIPEIEEPPQETKIKNDSLQSIIQYQEQQILKYQTAIDSIDDSELEIDELQDQFNSIISSISSTAVDYIQNIDDKLIPIEQLEQFTSLDEEVSQQLANLQESYQKATTQAQESLMLEHGSEYTDICSERASLLATYISNLKQGVMAQVAKSKYESALKGFENLVLREAHDKLCDQSYLQEQTSKLQQESEEASQMLKSLMENDLQNVLKKIAEQSANLLKYQQSIQPTVNDEQLISYESILEEFEQQKQTTIQAQKAVLNEQKFVQDQYDMLYQIQQYLQELPLQFNYRQKLMEQTALREKLLQGDRQTIDERDEQLNKIPELLGKNEISEIIQTIGNLKSTFQQKTEQRQQTLSSDSQQLQSRIAEIKKQFQTAQEIYSQCNFVDTSNLEVLIDETRKTIQVLKEEHQNLYRDIVRSPNGTTERQIFVQYLTEEDPEFLKDIMQTNQIPQQYITPQATHLQHRSAFLGTLQNMWNFLHKACQLTLTGRPPVLPFAPQYPPLQNYQLAFSISSAPGTQGVPHVVISQTFS